MNSELKIKIDDLKESKQEADRKECILLLQDYLKTKPEDAQAWYDLAGSFDFIGEEKKAEPCYKKTYDLGIEKLPIEKQTGFYIGYGSTLRNNLKFTDSSQILKSAADAFSKYPAIDVFWAFTLHSEVKYKQASEQLFKAVSKIEGKEFDGYEKTIQWYTENLNSHPKRELPPEIHTDRLILRPIQASDVEAIFEYCSIPEVSKHTTWEAHKTIDDSMKLVDYAKANYQRGLVEPLAITLKDDKNKLIGTVGWFWNSERYKSIELAYALSPKFWGQGLVLEACKALINKILKTNEILRITSRCMSENTSSARVMEKMGMEYEGTQKQLMNVKGRWVDIKNYCILAKDWK